MADEGLPFAPLTLEAWATAVEVLVEFDMFGLEDGTGGPWLSPDCWAGKHEPACSGGAWDEDEDGPTGCQCPCHEDYDPDDWRDDDEGPAVVDVPVGDYL